MNSLDVKSFDVTIRKYIREQNLPAEVKRLVLQNIVSDIAKESEMEINAELENMEKVEKGVEEDGN